MTEFNNPLWEKLNGQQRKAVRTIDGQVQICAVAGSGKTTVIVHRTEHMINDLHIDPKSIALMTFTAKAAQEMGDRLKKLISKRDFEDMFCGTSHSFGYRVLAKELKELNHPLQNFTRRDLKDPGLLSGSALQFFAESVKESLLKMPFDLPVLRQIEEIGVGQFLKVVSLCKNQDLDHWEYEALTRDDATPNQIAYIEFYKKYETMKEARKAIDFDDMLFITVRLFRTHPEILRKYQRQIKYVVIDETQDNNKVQYALAEMISAPEYNLFVVGDDDQCQPEGQRVLTTNGYKEIQDLNPNTDRLVSYDKRGSLIVGFKNGYNFNMASRPYDGKIFVVKTDSKSAKSTNNHKWLAKWTKASKENAHVVYLMQKGRDFRIGWCKLFNADGGFHLGVRAKLQNADNAWIIKIFDNKIDASCYESAISTVYGLPLNTFVPQSSSEYNGTYSEASLKQIFDTIHIKLNDINDSLEARAKRVLESHNKYMEFPIWSKRNLYKRTGGSSINEFESCNLESNYMEIPEHVRGKIVEWKVISVEVEQYTGVVYSLGVEKYETYITEGLVTHNCMYAFRGAEPNLFIDFCEKFENAQMIPLEDNYRSKKGILTVANKLIGNNTNRIQKELVAHNETEDKVVFHSTFLSEVSEAEFVANEIDSICNNPNVDFTDEIDYKRVFVLYRTNAQCKEMEDALIGKGIPYVIHGGMSFYERKEVKDILSYLRLVEDEHDDEAFKRVYNVPSRYLGKAFYSKVSTSSKYSAWTMCELANLTNSERNGVSGLKRLVGEMKEVSKKGGDIPTLIDYLMENGYSAHLKKGNNATDEDNEENEVVDKLKFFSKRFDSVKKLIEYVELMAGKRKESVNGVQLMTIHRSKGLEAHAVFGLGLNEGILPHAKSIEAQVTGEKPLAIEEERRLAYVLATRAESLLYLSSTKTFNGKEAEASRFVEEMGLIEVEKKEQEVSEEQEAKAIAEPVATPIIIKPQRVANNSVGILDSILDLYVEPLLKEESEDENDEDNLSEAIEVEKVEDQPPFGYEYFDHPIFGSILRPVKR